LITHPRIADAEHSTLILIDLQESYRGKLHEEARTLAATSKLLRAAELLGIPVFATEQYPERLGATRSEIAPLLPAATRRFAKRSFSCLRAEGLGGALRELGRDQVVVAGIETHVCVSQTVHDLLHEGYRVHVVRDAVTARFPLEDETGFAKMTGSGAVPTSVEALLFEWLRDSRAPEFKAIHKLVV
jgi:nicotinamidase-related amidase